MSETKHPWCRDVSRDEAIRAEEDAAAANRVPPPDHRELPQAVAELRERVARLEDHFADASKMVTPPQITEGDTLATVRDGGGRPMPKGPPPGLKAKTETAPADGLRTERVLLEVTQQQNNYVPAREWSWREYLSYATHFLPGESVRVVEEEWVSDIDRVLQSETTLAHTEIISALTAERNAARDECERLRHLLKTKESECETHHPWVHPTEAAPAANAGGEAKQEPVAWVATKPGDDGGYQRCLGWDRHKVILGIDLDASSHPVSVSPLYAAPPPPRGWLTEEDCEALYLANAVLHGVFVGSWREKHDASKRLEAIRVRAIREAGGEVE